MMYFAGCDATSPPESNYKAHPVRAIDAASRFGKYSRNRKLNAAPLFIFISNGVWGRRATAKNLTFPPEDGMPSAWDVFVFSR
jgi:hypothetical protein